MTSGRRPETRNSGIQGFRDHTFDRGSEAPAIDATRRRLSTRGRASLDPPPTAHRRRRRLRRRRRRGGRRRRDGSPSPAMARPSRLAPSPWKAQTTLPLYPNPSPDPNRRAGARVFASRLSDGDEDEAAVVVETASPLQRWRSLHASLRRRGRPKPPSPCTLTRHLTLTDGRVPESSPRGSPTATKTNRDEDDGRGPRESSTYCNSRRRGAGARTRRSTNGVRRDS